jgi:predicted ATPase
MIKKIGIQNFRVFKEFTEFEIKPITLLVGPNNAGKSSFTKLLLLLKNGITKLNFEDGLHNLESFDKVLNCDANSKFLKVRYENRLEFLNDNFYVDVIYSANEMSAINISNGNENLLNFCIGTYEGFDVPLYILNLNINFFISLIYNDLTTSFSKISDNRTFLLTVPVDGESGRSEEVEFTNYEGDLSIENYVEIFKNNKPTNGNEFDEYIIGSVVLKHEFKKLKKDYLLYDLFIKGKNVTADYSDKIIELQTLGFSKNPIDIQSLNVSLNASLLYVNEMVKGKIISYFSKLLNQEDFEIKETRLGKLVFTEKLFNPTDSFGLDPEVKVINYQKTLIQQFGNFSNGLGDDFSGIEYLSANRGRQKRTLNNYSENDIDKIVLDFFNKSDQNMSYIEKMFHILEIPGTLKVERIENVISVVYLIVNGKKIALADVGFGYSQLIPIILKIADIITTDYKYDLEGNKVFTDFRMIAPNKESKILIIEEPEANLHPSLQSKLADMLVTTNNHFPELNFIIETHSEYMIRKLQYLTAKNKIDPSKSIIYYFNADKYVSAKEPKVKAIEITSNGNLTDTFGPGFYDETTRLQFELMKLNQEQSN